MKKINLTLLVLFIGLSSIAQYKKASYFGKEGRTYGLGTRFYTLGGYSGTVMGYTLSLGKDTDGKRFFTGQEFQIIPSYKVQLEVLDSFQNSLSTTGLKQKDYALPNHTYGSASLVFRIISK